MNARWLILVLGLAPAALAAEGLSGDNAPNAVAAPIVHAGMAEASAVMAQAHPHHHATPSGRGASPSTRAYRQANERMHKDMAIRFTGDADKDFAAGMIPHHQGAIDMAKVVLAHGKDPEIRKLAEDIISAQEKEIAQLKAILQRLK
ncbi:MAG: DUF305 domain-containing protein [Alphaproteobacteria bacterium]|nr:DUF305 domain-containing protein [Alphaproteobacteria bacterium]